MRDHKGEKALKIERKLGLEGEMRKTSENGILEGECSKKLGLFDPFTL